MKVAMIEATQIGFRVTIKCGAKSVASCHFAAKLEETGYGVFASPASINAAYESAKKFAASHGCN